MICFDVSSLIPARPGKSLALDLDTGPERLVDLDVDFLRGTLQVIRIQSGLLVRGSVRAQLELECVRCLEPFISPLTLDVEEVFRLQDSSLAPDIPYVVSDDGWLDLVPLLREHSWLGISMHPICRSDCKGLCQWCGANLDLGLCGCEAQTVDPRRAVLKELLEERGS